MFTKAFHDPLIRILSIQGSEKSPTCEILSNTLSCVKRRGYFGGAYKGRFPKRPVTCYQVYGVRYFYRQFLNSCTSEAEFPNMGPFYYNKITQTFLYKLKPNTCSFDIGSNFNRQIKL